VGAQLGEPPRVPAAPEPKEGVGLPAGAWRPVNVLTASLAVIVLSIIEVGVVAAFDPDLESPAARLGTQGLLAMTLIVVALVFASSPASRLPLAALGLRRFKPSALGIALATFGGYVLFAAAYASVVQPEQEDLTRELGFDEGTAAAIAAGLLIVAAAPLSEEIFFRGFMFAGLRRRVSLWPAAAVPALVWGSLHYTGPDSIGVVPQLVAFGLLLAWLYEYTGSLWPPILVHVINNGIAFAIVTST
jgi:membrane protease YdiL (CAAX protease family)